MPSEIRKDYIQEKYVIIAPRRSARPALERPVCEEQHPPASRCPFCPARLSPREIIATSGPGDPWEIAVVENAYPAVSLENVKAYGKQEVVIETPDHAVQLEDLHEEHIADILSMYGARTSVLSEMANMEYILTFKNSGGRAGASLLHAHSQLFATSFLPPHLLDKSQKIQEYKLRHGTCVYCDVMRRERESPRFVWEDEKVIAFSPYASMHNYEVWILPKRHIDNISLLTEQERLSWATILKQLLLSIIALKLPYNFYFHQLVHDEDQHVYMKITPRGSVWAGVEIGSGLIINPVPPEEAAEYYRQRF